MKEEFKPIQTFSEDKDGVLRLDGYLIKIDEMIYWIAKKNMILFEDLLKKGGYKP